MKNFGNKNWVIGILVSSFVATFVVGFLHEKQLLSESLNPLLHVLRDWLIVLVFVLPISYLIAKILPGKPNVV